MRHGLVDIVSAIAIQRPSFCKHEIRMHELAKICSRYNANEHKFLHLDLAGHNRWLPQSSLLSERGKLLTEKWRNTRVKYNICWVIKQ